MNCEIHCTHRLSHTNTTSHTLHPTHTHTSSHAHFLTHTSSHTLHHTYVVHTLISLSTGPSLWWTSTKKTSMLLFSTPGAIAPSCGQKTETHTRLHILLMYDTCNHGTTVCNAFKHRLVDCGSYVGYR